jgi:CRISPR-associated endonuclease/helicase Cas3
MEFWGKLDLDRASGGVKGILPLVDHCLDVAAVFRELCELPAVRRALGKQLPVPVEGGLLDRLAVIAYLHDLGKCNTGFQAKRDPNEHHTAGHIKEVAPLFFDDVLSQRSDQALGLTEIASWFSKPEECGQLLLASISHHGRPAFESSIADGVELGALRRHWGKRDGVDPFDGLRELGETARSAFPSAFDGKTTKLSVTVEFEHFFAGLVMLADWLGSHREAFFPFEHQGDRATWSRQQARKALLAVGLDVSAARKQLINGLPAFGDVFGIKALARPLQTALTDADLPSLLIAESETGSGKTEAALMHFLALFAAGHVDGMYFALPTRVAARELYGRVLAAMRNIFGSDHPPVLLAVPGYAQVDGEPRNLLPDASHLFHEEALQHRERGWSAERPKRFLAAPIAVGTIDQALLSAIQVPHAHLRAAALSRSLLVIDEVHSSDVYMRYLSRSLIDRHLHAGGRALLLSATLGSAARAEYFALVNQHPAEEPLAVAEAQPYPSLSSPGLPMRALGDPARRSKQVRLEPVCALKNAETMLPRLRGAMSSGQRVLVVLNTVSRAIALTRLAESDPELVGYLFSVAGVRCPHHGRFARADRELMDKAVSERLGKGSPSGAFLLIGTQTLEQSLDIDADWLLTDLCPVDVLLQRIGRLHRHDRGQRPTPICTVLLPEEENFSVFTNQRGEVKRGDLAGLGSVYEDLRILQLTRDFIATSPDIEIPRDNRQLVEMATHPECLRTLQSPAWERHAQHIQGMGWAQAAAADRARLPVDKPFGEFSFPPIDDGLIATRLGLNDRRLFLGGSYTSPFGQAITEVNLPGHLAKGLDSEQARLVSQSGDSLIIQADPQGRYVYRYSRFGLEKQ